MKKQKSFRRDITKANSCGDPLHCWVCGGAWPSQYDLMLDTVLHELRIDRRMPIKLRPRDTDALEVLIDAFPRWISISQWKATALGGDPDEEMRSFTWTHLAKMFEGTRYTIQRRDQSMVRLVDVDTLKREAANELGQIPNTGMNKTSGAGTELSQRLADENKRFKKPSKKAISKAAEKAKKQSRPGNGAKAHGKRPYIKKGKTHV